MTHSLARVAAVESLSARLCATPLACPAPHHALLLAAETGLAEHAGAARTGPTVTDKRAGVITRKRSLAQLPARMRLAKAVNVQLTAQICLAAEAEVLGGHLTGLVFEATLGAVESRMRQRKHFLAQRALCRALGHPRLDARQVQQRKTTAALPGALRRRDSLQAHNAGVIWILLHAGEPLNSPKRSQRGT